MGIECGESEKNVEKLVEAFAQVSAQHQDAELVVVGDGPHLDALKALAKDHPVVCARPRGAAARRVIQHKEA